MLYKIMSLKRKKTKLKLKFSPETLKLWHGEPEPEPEKTDVIWKAKCGYIHAQESLLLAITRTWTCNCANDPATGS